jgi:hypothetical protein
VPYRFPGRPRLPESPDVDENLLKRPWWSHALLVSLVYMPFVIWWLVMVEGGNGPRQVTPSTKIGIAVAFALWLVVLLILRARHQRVVQAALARMEQETEEPSHVRVADERSGRRDGDVAEHEVDSESRQDARRRG